MNEAYYNPIIEKVVFEMKSYLILNYALFSTKTLHSVLINRKHFSSLKTDLSF